MTATASPATQHQPELVGQTLVRVGGSSSSGSKPLGGLAPKGPTSYSPVWTAGFVGSPCHPRFRVTTSNSDATSYGTCSLSG